MSKHESYDQTKWNIGSRPATMAGVTNVYGIGEQPFIATYYACRDERDVAGRSSAFDTIITYSSTERDKLAEVLDKIMVQLEELKNEDYDSRFDELEGRISKIEQALVKLVK